MSARWFLAPLPSSRSMIENKVRLAFWKAGLGEMWITNTRDEPPYECLGLWHAKHFRLEWNPRDYVLLEMSEPNEALLKGFERVLGHRALAAYRKGDGAVCVEWSMKNGDARVAELETSGVKELERLQG